MNRNRPRYRAMPFSAPGESIRVKRIFVIKRASRLPATDAKGRTIQRILIFDDHPASLRLVFGRRPISHVDHTAPQSATWWEPVVGWTLVMCALLLILLPLFLKLPS